MTSQHEKRILIASVLSAVLTVAYFQLVIPKQVTPSQPVTEEVRASHASASDTSKATKAVPQSSTLVADESRITLESKQLRLEVGSKTADVYQVTLKQFKNLQTQSPLQFGGPYRVLQVEAQSSPAEWKLVSSSMSSALWSRQSGNLTQELNIALDDNHATWSTKIRTSNQSDTDVTIPVVMRQEFARGDEMSGQYNALEAVLFTIKQQPWHRQYLTYHPMKSEKTVPRGTSMATVSERYFCLAVKPQQPWNSFTITPSENIATRLDSNLTVPAKQVVSYEFSSYAGPRDTFYMQKAGFAQAFAIGFMGQIGLILMMFLRFLANIFKNYGVSIIVFSVLVTTALSPFTLISLKSMKKLKDIQPKLDQLKAKHAKDPQKLNQEMLAIFREHKVSPMSGCLPMLLQLPIFFALWSAMTHVIELRGEQFLWIKDLSLPDRLFRFNGFDLNILPILMSGAMYFQSKMSQQSTSSKEAQMFSAPLMSVIFGFMFYGVPSGLVLYWLSNTLTSLFFYRMALK